MEHKLTVELVPKTAWYSNVRSNVSNEQWNIIRKKCYQKANYKCEICGETGLMQGYRHAVECHEIWLYNDVTHTQTLIGFIALCPYCHETKHAGLAQLKGRINILINRLMSINNMTREEADDYIQQSFLIWEVRSLHDWELDILYLEEYLKS